MDAKQAGPSKARRRVIQGSLAAPVVLTVSSASATSVTSFGRCLANLNNQQPGKFFITETEVTTDNWLRKQVDVVQLAWGQKDVDWFYLDPTQQLYVRLSNPAFNPVSPLDKNYQTKALGKRWALVWVDSMSGTPYKSQYSIVVQVQKPSGCQATTKSCYTSLVAAR
jgi:hypothetical protein